MEEEKGLRLRLEGQDPLLHPFLSALGDQSALAELDTLLRNEAVPIIRKIVNQRLGLSSFQPRQEYADPRYLDAQDLNQQTLVALTSRLWRVHVAPEANRITEFRSYVAGATFNTWRGAVRNDARLWARLSGRLAYLCRGSAGHTGFVKWHHDHQGPVAGFELWRRKNVPVAQLQPPELDPPQNMPRPETPLPEVAEWVLRRAGGPLPWNDFVTSVALILQVKTERVSLDPATLDQALRAGTPNDPGTVGQESLNKDRLRLVWEEIQSLDRKERAVLLLKAEDLLDFDISQVATLETVAHILEFSADQLALLLPRLPLDDYEIAGLLGVQRQTVVNLRSQARATLRRRLSRSTDFTASLKATK